MRKRTRQSSRHSNKIASTAPAENQGQVNIDAGQQQTVNEEGNSASSKGTSTSLVTNDEHVECEDHTLDLALDTEERKDAIGITSMTVTDVEASGNIKDVGKCAHVNKHVEGKEIVAADITNGCNQNGASFSLDGSDCGVERCQNSISVSKDKDTRDVETKLRVPSNSSSQGELQKSSEIETDMEEITNSVNSYGRVIADGQYCSESRDSQKRRLDEELTDSVSLSQKRTKKFKPPVSTNIAKDSCNVNMSITSDAPVQSVAMSKDDHVSMLNNNADEDLNIVNIDTLRATQGQKNVIAVQSLAKLNVQSKILEDNSIIQTKIEESRPNLHDAVQAFEEYHQRTSQRDTDESQSQTLTKIFNNDEQSDMAVKNMSLHVTNNTMSVGQSKSDSEAINYLGKTNENAQGNRSVSETKPHSSNLENISMRKDVASSEKSICIGKCDSTYNNQQCSVEKSKERHHQCSSDMIPRQNLFEHEDNSGYRPTSNKIDDPNSIQDSSKTKLISVDDISNTCGKIKELIKVNETEHHLDDKTNNTDQTHDHKDIIDKEIPNQINRASEEESSKECVISKDPSQSSRSSQDKVERITSGVENKSSKLQNHNEFLMCTQPFTISTQDPNELSQGNNFSFNGCGQLSKNESSSKIVTQPEFLQSTLSEVIATENVKQNHHTVPNIFNVNSFAVLTPKSPKFSPKSSQERSTKLMERTDEVVEFSVYSERVLGVSRESNRNDQTGLHPLEYSKDITNVSSALTKLCDSQINEKNEQVDGILDSSNIRPKNVGILTGTLQSLLQKHPSVQNESSCKGHDSKYAEQNSDTTANFALFECPPKRTIQDQKAVTDMFSMSTPANKKEQHAEVPRITNDNPMEKNSPVKPNLEQPNNCSPTGISESAFSGDNQKVNHHSQFSHCMPEKTSADNILISAAFPNNKDVSDMITIKDTFTAGITDSSSNKDILDTSIIGTTGTASDTGRTLPNDKCQATDTNQKVPDDRSHKNISNLSETPGCLPVTGQPVDDMDLTDSQLCEVPAGGEMAVQSDVSTTLARSRSEGKRLVSAIMADLTDVNRQLLRLKREMDAAQRKINAQNKRTYHPYQQNHQQQTSRPGQYKQSTMGQTRRTF